MLVYYYASIQLPSILVTCPNPTHYFVLIILRLFLFSAHQSLGDLAVWPKGKSDQGEIHGTWYSVLEAIAWLAVLGDVLSVALQSAVPKTATEEVVAVQEPRDSIENDKTVKSTDPDPWHRETGLSQPASQRSCGGSTSDGSHKLSCFKWSEPASHYTAIASYATWTTQWDQSKRS